MTTYKANRPPTLADVAARANVSAMTVSRVVNGSSRVNEDTKNRVQAAMDELAYIPNQLARGLVIKRTGLIALVVADITHPWFTELAHSAELAAGANDFTTVLANTDGDIAIERAHLEKLSALRVDGILLVPAGKSSAEIVRLLQKRGTPLVMVDREVTGISADVVRGESDRTTTALVEHLIDHGYRRIAAISGPVETSNARVRMNSYRAAVRAGGLTVPRGQAVHASYTREGGYRAALKILRDARPPDAIFTANSFIAFGVIDAARELGLQLPEDLAIVTFDDLEKSGVYEPFLTCGDQPAREIGAAAVETLMARLNGASHPPEIRIFESTLRIRRSCGCSPSV